MLRFLGQDLGLEIKDSETEGRAKSLCVTGLLINCVLQIVTVTPKRAGELEGDLKSFLDKHSERYQVDRVELASLIGRWQFCAGVIPGSQSHLIQAYRARDASAEDNIQYLPPKRQWRGVPVVVSPGLLSDFTH